MLAPVGGGYITTASAVAAGDFHSLAITEGGALVAWGYNTNGQIGDGTTTERPIPQFVVNPNGAGVLSGVTAVAAGQAHTVALLNNGTVLAWDYNGQGQLGDGSTTSRSIPTPVNGLSNIVGVAAGWNHSLAVRNDGAVFAWGWNPYGALGNNTVTDSTVPVQVKGVGNAGFLGGAVAVTAGRYHSAARLANGTVVGWGYNASGELGDGSLTNRLTPVNVVGLSNITAVSAGPGGAHTLALGPNVPAPTVTPVPTATPQTIPATPTAFSFPATSTGLLYGINPVRAVDTRGPGFGPTGFDGAGIQIAAAPFQDGDLRTYRIAGKTFQGFTIPPGAKAVNFNVTALQAAPSGGFVTVFPGGASLPATSSLNPSGATGATANAGFTLLDAAGNLQIKSVGAVRDLILDITGYYQQGVGAGAGPRSVGPPASQSAWNAASPRASG